jgi:hypothetical protein
MYLYVYMHLYIGVDWSKFDALIGPIELMYQGI